MDSRLKELQELCKEIAIHYTTERDMKEYGKIAIALIGRQDKEERLKNKLQNLETVLKDKEVPEDTVDKAYKAYEILTSYLNLETKPIDNFREEPIKEYSFDQIISEKPKDEIPIKEGEGEEFEDALKGLQDTVSEELAKIDIEEPKTEEPKLEEIEDLDIEKEKIEEKPEELQDISALGAEEIKEPEPELEAPKPEPKIEPEKHYEKSKIKPKTKKEVYKPKKKKRRRDRDKGDKKLRGLAIPLAAGVIGVLTTAAILGKKYTEIKTIEKEIENKQKLCKLIIEKGDIKSLANKLDGQTLYAGDLSKIINEEIKPGKYKLSDLFSCLGHHFKDEINTYLDSSEIDVKKRKKIFSCPLDGRVVKKCYFGQTGRIIGGKVDDKAHGGDDICGLTNDTIYAAADGVVHEADRNYKKWIGYGKKIVIQHDGNLKTLYAHCRQIYVNEGDSVKTGDKIGLEGSTGHATGPHVHFEVRKGAVRVNPTFYYDYRHVPSAQDVKENNSNAYIIYKTLAKDE